MKKASYITTRIWVLGMCLGCHAGEQEVPWNSFFHAEHRDIVADATGEKCVFRGVSIQGLEFGAFETNPYPGTLGVNYFSPQSNDIVRLADWGFNVVRIPFEWARLVPAYHAGEPVAWQTNYLALLDEAVEWSRQNRVYVILSMHDYLKYWSASNQLVYVDGSPVYQGLLTNTWRAIAAHYCTNKAVAGFEIMNEPVRGHDTNWHAIAQATVRAIRSVDTNHLVVIDGRNYSLPGIWPRDNGTNTFVTDTINPPRIVYAPHIYYGAGGTANTYPEGGTPITGWEYYLRDRLMPVIEWSIANDVPIMVSESGIPNTSGWASVLSNVFANYYAPLGISHIYWAWLDEGKIGTDVNRLVADGYQLAVLRNNLGGTYRPGVFFTPVKHSPLYDGSVVPPWTNLSWWIVGQETIDFSGPANSEGRKTIAVTFTQSWSCVKFYYDYVDTSRYSYLRFAINTGTYSTQDLLIQTEDLEYNTFGGIRMSEHVTLHSGWNDVRIPMTNIVNPGSPIITAVCLKNVGVAQPTFYLSDMALVEPQSTPVFTGVGTAGGNLTVNIGNLTPKYGYTTVVEIVSDLASTNWQPLAAFEPSAVRTNLLIPMPPGTATLFLRTR